MTEEPHSHLQPNLLLSSAMFYILLSLADGPKHGYAIMKEVEEITDGQIVMGPGSLYGSIKKLVKAKIIEESSSRPVRALDDERRRYYTLTQYGRQVLSMEVNRLAKAVRLAQRKSVFDGAI